MRKVKINVPAKVNLTLDVLGVEGGYHKIKSLVASVTVFDTIILKRRKDTNINLSVSGPKVGVDKTHNNAYISAKAFMERFKTYGVDIKLIKRIPIGGGMGGSSADIVAVLCGMNKLFGLEEDIYPLANALGSDTAYMVEGGTKIISGRGEIITDTKIDKKLYFNALKCDKSISAKKCYATFDALEKRFRPCTKTAVEFLEKGDFIAFTKKAKNDLYHATAKEIAEIDKNLAILKEVGAPMTIMTGSGTVVLSVYDDKKQRDCHYKKLKANNKNNLFRFETI